MIFINSLFYCKFVFGGVFLFVRLVGVFVCLFWVFVVVVVVVVVLLLLLACLLACHQTRMILRYLR